MSLLYILPRDRPRALGRVGSCRAEPAGWSVLNAAVSPSVERLAMSERGIRESAYESVETIEFADASPAVRHGCTADVVELRADRSSAAQNGRACFAACAETHTSQAHHSTDMLRALTARSGRSVPRDSIVGRQTHLVQLSGLIKTYIGGWGMPEVDDQFSHIVPGAAAKADQFLRVVRDRCNNMQIGLTLEAAQRSRRDGGGQCLKGDLGSGQGIEVFADPMGPGLHVGFQLTNAVVGGPLAGVGVFGDINRRNARRQNKSGNVRAVTGKLNGFQQLVLGPVIQELTDAVAQQQQPAANGFLGA